MAVATPPTLYLGAIAIVGIGASAFFTQRPWVSSSLKWESHLDIALAQSRVNHKPIFVDVYETGCAACDELDKNELRDSDIQGELQAFTLAKVLDSDKSLPPKMRDVPGFPTLFILDSGGKILRSYSGAPYKDQFLTFLREGNSNGRTLWPSQFIPPK